MKLLTKELIMQIPSLYDQDGKGVNQIAYAKLFTPDANWSWYITEFDPGSKTCFGLVDGNEKELGYFSLEDISNIRGPLGLKVERDLSFEKTSLKNLGFNYGE